MTAWYIAIPVIIIAGTAFVWAVTRHKGRHQQAEARAGVEADTFISELRHPAPWEDVPRPARPAPTMTIEPPLRPLPDLVIVTDDTITPADVDQAYQDALAINQPAAVEPTTGEIFEHLHEGDRCWCLPWKPAPFPAAVVEKLGHATVEEALNSIVMRSEEEAARFRAELEAKLAQDEHANGQVIA